MQAKILFGALFLCSAQSANAQEFPAPQDRNHSIDLYAGPVIGSAKLIGMGGASTAIAEGSSGMLSNISSVAVRPSTSNDTWDWDWHLDSLQSDLGSDSDNNGINNPASRSSFNPTLTSGLVIYYKKWGVGITVLSQNVESRFIENGQPIEILSTTDQVNLAIARSVWKDQLVLGVGLHNISLDLERTAPAMDMSFVETSTLFSLRGAQFNFAATWMPSLYNVRVGTQVSPPVLSDDINEQCDPLDCFGYILPDKAKAPWTVATGFAYRFANSRWNQKIRSHWRDESALILSSDILLTGTTQRGVGLEAFHQHQLQPAGNEVSVSLRAGAQYEWLPGRLRIRAGSYWEGARFLDSNGNTIPGRIHLTTGFDLRVWSFGFWNNPYRVKVSFAADFARKYGNSGISLGLWH